MARPSWAGTAGAHPSALRRDGRGKPGKPVGCSIRAAREREGLNQHLSIAGTEGKAGMGTYRKKKREGNPPEMLEWRKGRYTITPATCHETTQGARILTFTEALIFMT